MKDFSISKLIKNIKRSKFVNESTIPLEYVPGIPFFHMVNSEVYVTIPFLRYKATGEVDKTQVFPIRYTVTLSLPQEKIVGFQDLSVNPTFRKLDFNKAIGLFRHESVKEYTQKQFREEKSKLYACYDKILIDLVEKKRCKKSDCEEFCTLLNILLEPSLKPIYRALNKEFYTKFISE